MRVTILILAFLCSSFVASKNLQNRYDNFKVYRVKIPNDASATIINDELLEYVDIWSEPRVGLHSDIMVSPNDISFVESKLEASKMQYSEMVENVQILIYA